MQKDKVVSEDDRDRGIDEVQKMVDKYTVKIEEALKAKEKEVLEV